VHRPIIGQPLSTTFPLAVQSTLQTSKSSLTSIVDMNPSSRKSATFSIGSDSSSVYSEDGYKSEANTAGTLVHHRSQLQPNLGGVYRENAQVFTDLSDIPVGRDVTTPDLEEDHDSTHAASSSHTAAYRFETREEAEERGRRSAVEARVDPHNASRNAFLEAPTTYMQRIPAEHDAASSSEFPALYRCGNPGHTPSTDVGDVFSTPPVPACSPRRVNSDASVPVRNMRQTVVSTASFVSTDAGELAAEYIRDTASLRNILRESMQRESIQEGIEPATPQARATSLSLSPSSLDLAQSSSLGPDREMNRDAALQALDGAVTAEDEIQPCGPDRWLGAGRQTSAAARRQSHPDWQKGTWFSSTGRQYGLGDHTKGYVSGDYVTVIEEAVISGKGKQKRSGLKRLFCMAG
jgi:hypothetical protein